MEGNFLNVFTWFSEPLIQTSHLNNTDLFVDTISKVSTMLSVHVQDELNKYKKEDLPQFSSHHRYCPHSDLVREGANSV